MSFNWIVTAGCVTFVVVASVAAAQTFKSEIEAFLRWLDRF